MKKKFFSLFLITLILLATLLPIGSAFSYTGGLLNGLSMNLGDSIDNTNSYTGNGTDNNATTFVPISANNAATDTLWYKFSKPVDISKIQSLGQTNDLIAYFYDSNKVQITYQWLDANAGTGVPFSINKVIKNVSYVAVTNNSASTIKLFEFDVFGTVATSSYTNLLSGKLPISSSSGDSNMTDGNLLTFKSFGAYRISTYEFTTAIPNLKGYFINSSLSVGNTNLFLQFFNSSNQLVGSNIYTTMNGSSDINWVSLDSNIYKDIKKVNLQSVIGSNTDVYEVGITSDVLSGSQPPVIKTDVTNVNVTGINKTVASVSWVNPTGYSGVTYNGAKIYVNNVLKTTTSSNSESYSLTGLQPSTNYSVRVTASYSDGTETTGLTKTFKTYSLSEITNLKDTIDYRTAKFTWINPIESEFNGVKIYRNDVLITTLDKIINDYSENITPSTTYTYKFVSTFTDGESNGITRIISTDPLPPPKKVINVNVSTTYNKVNLSWNLPEQEGLKHVNIYRVKTEKKPGFFESLFSLSGTKVYAAESDKIFETNGTYFNDFTVRPESEYEYTLTTQTDDGRESEGVKVIAETKKEPEPVLVDDGYTVEPTNGDYTFKWSEPTTGTVKVLVNGSHYKTVEASEKQIVIPNGDMKYTILGDPDISLVPISPYGKEGNKVTNPGGLINSLKLPFDVTDLLQTIMGIIGLFAPFILLTLVIYYFKPIKNLIVRAAHRIRNGDVRNE
jgi:hypothetical protein